MTYAWVIDEDFLRDDVSDDTGLQGPSTATDADIARLAAGEGYGFWIYDDDKVCYYRGRMVVSGDTDMADVCDAPLRDYATPGAGAVSIEWPGHPEWNAFAC